MSISKYPRRMLSDPVKPEDRKAFLKACKDQGCTPGEALAAFVKAWPSLKEKSGMS